MTPDDGDYTGVYIHSHIQRATGFDILRGLRETDVARILVSSVLESDSPARQMIDVSSTYRVFNVDWLEMFQRRKDLLRCNVSGTGMSEPIAARVQVAALHGVQEYCEKMGWPKHLCKGIFFYMYEFDLICENALYLWRDECTSPRALNEVGELGKLLGESQRSLSAFHMENPFEGSSS